MTDLPQVRGRAPWLNHEYVKGWGVFGLPFDSGHVLALRVFPEGSFGPYRTLWHRDPSGRWSIYVDGARLDTACPRYYGAACERTGYAHIGLTWTGPASLRVTMDSPSLDWSLTAPSTRLLDFLNSLSAALPLATWRPRPLVRARERMARALGMGRRQMSGMTPSGHTGKLMPKQMYLVDQAQATLDGVELGHPVQSRDNPRIGDVALPSRGVLAIGQGVWQILDQAEYERTDPRPGTSPEPIRKLADDDFTLEQTENLTSLSSQLRVEHRPQQPHPGGVGEHPEEDWTMRIARLRSMLRIAPNSGPGCCAA